MLPVIGFRQLHSPHLWFLNSYLKLQVCALKDTAGNFLRNKPDTKRDFEGKVKEMKAEMFCCYINNLDLNETSFIFIIFSDKISCYRFAFPLFLLIIYDLQKKLIVLALPWSKMSLSYVGWVVLLKASCEKPKSYGF